jgi:hypothetical protein
VNGGFLRGPNQSITGGATFNGTTAFSDVVLTQNGSATASLINFTSSGAIVSNGPIRWDGGLQTSGGTLQINNNGSVDASAVEIDGGVTIASGGILDAAQSSKLVLGAGSHTTVQAGAKLVANASATIELNSAMLSNDGTQTGTLNVNAGSTVIGAGTFGALAINREGEVSPGDNGVGSSTLAVLNLNPGGRYRFDLSSAQAAPGIGTDLFTATAQVDFSALGTAPASRFTIELQTVDSAGNPASLTDFDPTIPTAFTLATGASLLGSFSPLDFNVDTTGFLNVTDPGAFHVGISADSNSLLLVYVPEPASSVLLLAGGMMLAAPRRRRR